MKKRKWHKITAALASVAVILSSPGITDLVKGSSTEFVDMEPISEETITASENEENISRATEDFSETTEDISETTEEHEENFGNETAAEEGSENNEADSVDCIEDFSCEGTSDTENVSPDSASAVTVLQKAEETENTELAQGEAHKVRITSSVPAGQEAAKVRLYLADAQNESPVTDLKITLSSGESTQEIIKDPVQLPEALNQNELLTVTPVTEYQLDEDGDYVFDEDGNYQIAAYYLEYEVPAGGSTAFEASFVYTTDAEEYDFQAKLRARMFRGTEGTGEEISLNEEESRLTLIWNSQAEQETEDDALVEMEELAADDVGDAGEKIVYFAAPTEWTSACPGYQMKVWIQAGAEGEGVNKTSLLNMNDLNVTFDGMKVYSVSFTDTQMPYQGLAKLYFQAYENEGCKNEKQAINGWTAQSVFLGKLYDSKTSTWVDYTPFNPNDHTSFAGKTMYFENNTEEPLNAVNAVFYEKDAEGNKKPVERSVSMRVIQNVFSVIIPDEPCSYVQFQDASGNVLGDTYSNFYGQGADEDGVESVLFAVGSMDCYKYDVTPENSTWGVLGERTVYYDATLSKMSYARSSNRNDGRGIPYDSNSKVYYYATKSDGTSVHGVMKAVTGTDNNLWSTSLSGDYTQIRFAGYAVENATPSENGDGTELEDIPWNMKNPCYFGDDSDDVIYKGGNRDGYWGEKGSLRDAESGKGKNKNNPVVDIDTSTFTRNNNTLYVDSTFYDYYTDYELNGNNRNTYTPGDQKGGSQRNYVTFRQFDQALSDYYKSKDVRIPIYTGHFQPQIWGTPFSDIADTLNLYGYDSSNEKGFMSTNNSALNVDGNNGYYDSAAQGLVSNTLNKGNLMEKDGKAQEPHFNESFLTGTNSKNTVLGKVYHNVSFPFTKQKLDINGNKCNNDSTPNVDYWYFDSADTTLAMRKDSASGEYYLQDTGKQEWSRNVDSSSSPKDTYGFFPFNENTTDYSAGNYNYGFGTKLEFEFRLTENGKVTASDGKTEFPIQFTFSGDDDVWVYVDGKLALDVGGAHGRVDGKLDFSNKTATVSKTKKSQGSSDERANIQREFNLSGSNTDEHTLTMFYMERGMWESNMKVTFNFPDENQLQVEKQVDTTDVNDLFKDLFKDKDLFDFTIKNLATHYGTKAASATTTAPVEISTRKYDVAPAHRSNVFEKATKEGFTDSVRWYAKEQDPESTYRSQRYGELTLDSPVDISNMQYLEFKFYYDHDDTPSLSNMYLQLVDSSGKEAGCLDNPDNPDKETLSGRTYGTVYVASKQWITVKLDLTKLSGIEGFGSLKKIRFGYNYPRDIYLKDFIFRPTAELTASTGFVTKQYDIADYGSAKSGKLENPKGAVYTSSAKSGAYAIEDDGSFVLRDKETITFKDQFRRGSYIYLKEEVDPNLFDTTWTMFENNGSVSRLNKVAGLSVNDGRTENKVSIDAEGKDPQVDNKYDGNRPKKQSSENTIENHPEDTFVFRSYANPDDTTTLTKLKAVFYNKVKTGSLKLTKLPAYSPADASLTGTYTFNITFTNVGGAGLEKEPIVQTVQLNLNETKEITGIPIGTFFTIKEITPTDGSTLDSIWLNGVQQEKGTTVLHGDINAATSQAEVVFKNTKKPKVNLSVQKNWVTGENYTGTLPDKIYVQLQRRLSDKDTWKAVKYNNSSDTDYTELTYNIYTEEWKTSFKDLDKYVDYTKSQLPQDAWKYRIVEVTVTKDADGTVTAVTPVKNGGCIEFAKAGMFKVSYDYANPNSDSEISIGEDNNGSATIINTYQPSKTSIQILKIKAGTSGKNLVKLAGAEFKLEKLTADGNDIDSAFVAQTVTTGGINGNGELGVAKFENLEDGTYQITETKAPEGYNPETKAPERYNLLKSPIKVVINRRENFITVDGVQVDGGQKNSIGSFENNTLTIQVANQAKFQLPATGSWSRLILGFTGAIIAGTAVIMYLLLQKRRKEGKTS